MEYKKNHTIPKVILKQWVSDQEGRQGVFIYDIDKGREYFSSSNGGRAFSFAITNYLYVPDIDGIKHPNLEKWKSGLESILATFIQRIKNKQVTGLANNNKEIAQILMSVISLDASSQYDIEMGYKFLEDNPEYKNLISDKPEREVKILLLENIVNSVAETVGGYEAIDFTLCTIADEDEFIYCDRPLIDKPFDETSFIVLTKKILLAYKATKGISTILYRDCNPLLVNTINEIMAERSRKWMIASDKAILDRYIPIIGSERWINSKDKDSILYVPVNYLKNGNYF
jgi:hypothetical protein